MHNFSPEETEIINNLQQKLFEEAEQLHLIAKSFEEELHNDDIQAHELLKTAISHATHEFKEIGYELDAYGGVALMQSSIYKVSNSALSIKVIEHAWDGIGLWVV